MADAFVPAPYRRDADENVQCPVCQKYNDNDAQYCDQCGTKLAGRMDVSMTRRSGQVIELDSVPMGLRAQARSDAADKGQALPGGSYPVRNLAELDKARQAFGRANPADRGTLKAFLLKRAKALGASQDVINAIQAYST
jgi:hypothetical protein